MAGRYRKYDYSKVVEFISAYTEQHGFAPAWLDICAGCNIPSTSHVSAILKVLRSEKRIEYEPGKARTLRVIQPAAQ